MQDEEIEERTGLSPRMERRLLEAKAYMGTEAYKQHSLEKDLVSLTKLGLNPNQPMKDHAASRY